MDFFLRVCCLMLISISIFQMIRSVNLPNMNETLNTVEDLDSRGGFSKEYLDKMSGVGEWGDGKVLAAASLLYKRSIYVIQRCAISILFPFEGQPNGPPMTIGYVGTDETSLNHYVSLTLTKLVTGEYHSILIRLCLDENIEINGVLKH